jgi:rRNA maturation RNase YbeY
MQDGVSVSCEHFISDGQIVMSYLGYQDFDLAVVIVDDATMQQYNKTYRNKDKSTDVLSFPFHTIEPGARICPADDEEKNIGDIIISAPYVAAYCTTNDVDFAARMQRLLVHGICHLLGYDHQTEEEYQQMYALELELLKLIQ